VGNQFNAALAVFYVSYLLVEVPSNIVMKKMKPNRWIPFLVFLWGIVTTLTGLVQSYGGLIAIRIFLGLCEGGLLPGMILYLSTMYKRHELQLRVGIFYASASLSGAFGGLLASAITRMQGVGGLEGWRWIFILEGLATVLASLMSAYILPADLQSARFFTEEERAYAVQRFKIDNITTFMEVPDNTTVKGEKQAVIEVENIDAGQGKTSVIEEEFEWSEVIRGALDVQTWVTAMAYFGLVISLYSFSYFLPTIITGLGYSGSNAQLHTVPPYVPAVVLTVVVSVLGDRLKWRGPFILIFLPLTIIGYIMLIAAKTNGVRYAAVFLVAAGIYPAGPCILSILPNNSSGHYKKATSTAMQLAISNSGGFLATFVYTPNQAPTYIRGHSIVLAFVIFAWVMVAVNVAYCSWENKARREGRREGNITQYQALRNAGKTRAPIGDRDPKFLFTL